MAFIETYKLSKKYESSGHIITALDDVNLAIDRGEFVIILGPSGCGKSTLLNILGGLDRPTGGKIAVNGYNIAEYNQNQMSKYRKSSVGMVFQRFNLIDDITILENIMMPLKFAGFSTAEQLRRAENSLANVGLLDRKNSQPAKLSGGQQQRVAISRALVLNPEILLCDEPTGNLDSKTGGEIISLIQKQNQQGQTVILVTHNEYLVAFADRTICMLDGKITANIKRNNCRAKQMFQKKKLKNVPLFTFFRLAIKSLIRRKTRLFLTSSGIAIGAMAVVILVAFGAGLQRDFNNQIGTNAQIQEIEVSGVRLSDSFDTNETLSKPERKSLNDKTIADLKEIDHVETVFPKINFAAEMTLSDRSGRFYGASLEPLDLSGDNQRNKVAYGKFVASDSDNAVIIPYGLAIVLGFDNPDDIIGKEAILKNFVNSPNSEFAVRIAGVMSPDDKLSVTSYLPVDKSIGIIKGLKNQELQSYNPDLYDSVVVRVDDTANVTAVEKMISDKGFGATSFEKIAKSMTRTLSIMQLIMGIIGSVALLVASLGIANTMFMSILERTREIGVMKAVGARQRDIKLIFLAEAFLIGVIGGNVGLGLGYFGTKIVSQIVTDYLKSKGSEFPGLSFYIPLYLSLGVVIFSALVAAIAGYLPANRAAKLDPVAALRDE